MREAGSVSHISEHPSRTGLVKPGRFGGKGNVPQCGLESSDVQLQTLKKGSSLRDVQLQAPSSAHETHPRTMAKSFPEGNRKGGEFRVRGECQSEGFAKKGESVHRNIPLVTNEYHDDLIP